MREQSGRIPQGDYSIMNELTTQTKIAASRKRVGFLGVGWIGRHRLETLARSGLIEVAAIADPVGESVKKAGESTPNALLLGGLAELLCCNLDGIVIATPSALHAEQAVSALKTGLAVFCQKPLGRNSHEVEMVIEAARDANRLLGIDLSYRYLNAVQAMYQSMRAGDIGEVFSINLVFHNAYGPDKSWFYDAGKSGGGCVIDLGIHLVDLALWMLDFPTVSTVNSRLFAQGRPISGRGKSVEDFALAQIHLSTGAVANLACSWGLSAGCDAVIEASLYGTRGALSLRNINGSFYDFKAELFRGTLRKTLSEPPDDWGGRAAVEWASKLSGDGQYDPAVEKVIDVAYVLDAIYENAAYL